LIALLIRVLGQSPEVIVNVKLEFIDKIGLKQHLAQTRANGLAAMIKQMKIYALAYREIAKETKQPH
jgi:cysteine desulfuration protein SufE